MDTSRTHKSIKNTIILIISNFISILLGFISRRVLIYDVGIQYLGINGLMSNILTLFSLAESGIGTAIVYALYKPLAENNEEKIKSLMLFFKRVYSLLAGFTGITGFLFYPFLPIFLKGNTAENVNTIYFLFLFSSVSSYFWIYKAALNNADQNNYRYTIANTITNIIVLILKIVTLHFTQNYILYLSIDISSTMMKNIIFSSFVERKYPYLKNLSAKKIDIETISELKRNTKSLFFGKIGMILSQCADNLVISSIIGVIAVGMYSNYTTIINAISGFVGTFSNGITASMGNLIASSSSERIHVVFKRIDFINEWLYSFTSVCLICLIEPFVSLVWLGKDYLLPRNVMILSVVIYYLRGTASGVETVKNAAGLFYPDRFIPTVEALINLILSVFLAREMGISGVLVGTIISFVLCSFWIRPLIVYRMLIHKSVTEYWLSKLREAFSMMVTLAITSFIVSRISASNVFCCFILKAIVAVVVSNLCLLIVNRRNEEFLYTKDLCYKLFKKFFNPFSI